MSLLRKSNSTASSRRQINIKGVQDDVLLLPGNEYRAVLKTSSVNIELKSEAEQDALIETYQSFLNSLGCPLQLLIRIRELDMDEYVASMSDKLAGETNEVYRAQIQNYVEFVSSLVKDNKILNRTFYVVVPYSAKNGKDFEMVKEQLNLRCDIVTKGLSRMSMQSRRLSGLEMLDLFYSFYNPERAKLQPITGHALQQLQQAYIRKGEQRDDNTKERQETTARPLTRARTYVRRAGSSGRTLVRSYGRATGLSAARRAVRSDAFYLRIPLRGGQRVARSLNKFQSRRGR